MITNNLISHDEYFKNSEGKQIIVNDLVYYNGEDDIISNSIMTIYNGEIIDTIPRCLCPEGQGLRGRVRLGVVCPECGSEVKEVYDHIDSKLWLRAITIDGITIPFMNPVFWTLLSRALYGSDRVQGDVDYVRWLCDDYATLPPKMMLNVKHKHIEDLLQTVLGGKRSYMHFISKLPEVLDYMVKSPWFNKKKRKESDEVTKIELLQQMFLQEMANNGGRTIFSEYLPILGKNIFILENTAKGKFTNLKSGHNINVVRTWLKFCKDIKEREDSGFSAPSIDKIGREVCKVINKLSNLYVAYNSDQIYQKSGILRKHAYGARSHLCGRALITSIEGPHDRRDIQIPWSMAVTIFHPHMFSRLIKEGYSIREADYLLNYAVTQYDKKIDELLKQIIADGPDGKMPALFHRNQSLGSLVA